MRWFTADHLAQHPRGQRAGTLVDRGFWLDDVPRFIPRCRLLGHRPVVDGTLELRPGQPGCRWVCCDRCGLRPDPQGSLDPVTWNIGDRYTGPWRPALPHLQPYRREELSSLKGRTYAPGPWPTTPKGEIGGQLIIGRALGGAGIELKIGCAGSEHTLAGSLRLHRLGALHLHTQGFGQWLQRRLIPTGYDSRVIEINVSAMTLQWRLWANRNELSNDTPRWRDGRVSLDLRDWLWGTSTLQIEKVGEPCPASMRLPEGDEHEVTLQLKRWVVRRPRRSRSFEETWEVTWRCAEGVSFHCSESSRGSIIHGAQEFVSKEAVDAGTWPIEAVASMITRIAEQRLHARMAPTPLETVTEGEIRILRQQEA
jgi:hypothetical protein